MYSINVDFDNICGEIKPMHAINNIPTEPTSSDEAYRRLNEANIPYSRLHDTGGQFGGAHYVDTANIFPDFDADENDPASYDFAFTDVLLKNMTEHNIKPFYRLGTTIENYHKIKAYNIFPPRDFEKWARICEKIIRHYNEGWADGFYMNIEHWEIWNEPDNEPVAEDNPMWRGTREQYFELYKTASLHLKKCFPNLKIGGYGSCGFYAITDTVVSDTANSSSRVDYFVEFFHDFLDYVRKNKLPLDFFSWHSYAGIAENIRYAQYAKQQLSKHGFPDCPVYLNEWNPGTQNRGTQKDAAAILSMMLALQNTPTDMCMYYNMRLSSAYCGVFNSLSGDVFNAYYAFYMFGRLYSLKNQVQCTVDGDNIYAAAAVGEKEKGLAVANNNDFAVTIEINGVSPCGKAYRVNGEKTLSEENFEKNLTLLPYEIVYISG